MPTYEITAPDGKKWRVTAPEGASQDDVLSYAKSQWEAQQVKPQVSERTGSALRDAPRQLGLTARYGIEGVGQAVGLVSEPIRAVTDRVFGGVGRSRSAGQVATSVADALGLPTPQTPDERVVGDATRIVAGAGGLGAAGRAAQGAGGVVGQVGTMLASNPTQQLTSAAGAGLAGGSVREAGGGAPEQVVGALVGGLAAPAMVGGLQSAGGAVRRAVTPVRVDQLVDQQINLKLQGSGVDWAKLPERVRSQLRSEVASALKSDRELSPDALRRLTDFIRVNAQPTKGMLTQDPVQITLEQNLARAGANTTDLSLQRLPRLYSDNTRALLSNLDDLGAANAPDSFTAGSQALTALQRTADASKGRINQLYQAARDTQGRSAPLSGGAFTARANQLLDENLLGYAVPESVASKLNQISRGEVPFTVDFAEQLKTVIGNIQRADKGGATSKAMGLIRQALDETPLQPAPTVNAGNLPAIPGTVPTSPAVLGEESIRAFTRARQANRAFMQRVENTPALKAAMDGMEPDRFVQQFIIGSGATAKDVQALRRAVGSDPAALQAIRQNLVAHLKSQATGGTEDVNKFLPSSYNRALNNIGEQKLSAFFSADEIEQLRAVGRVGELMVSQPAGSAVNNSNTAAALIGRAVQMLDALGGRLPLGLDTVIQGTVRGIQQGRALDVPAAIATRPTVVGPSFAERLAPASVYGGLLATQPVNQP